CTTQMKPAGRSRTTSRSAERPSMKVGFIGLGNMGSAMARNLIGVGHELTVYNRTRSRADAFASLGAKIAETPAEAAASAEALITMLADDAAVEAVIFSPDNAIRALPARAVHISMSTVSVAFSRRLAESHRQHQQHYLAAPVFGRPEAAASAKLFVVAAGAAEQIERCRPLFDAIGQKTFQVGDDAQAANVVKLAGNFLITTMIESLAEALAFGRKSGVDAHALLDVLTNSLFTAPVYRNYGSMIASDTFEPAGFKLPLGLKDNRLLLAAAEEAAVPMPMASLVHDRFVAALALGLGEADWAAIARISYQNAGLRKEVT
ncbi:MAG TPA: NAD(P)-dependent oxidoreductase, partial [Vicinamibacterales bacterium]|nr:NAD(P)-dependent oxidoreductase [Vicinamibacterales bacterium]